MAVDLVVGSVGAWSGTVYADGFAADTPGPNVDPNVFSELLPWHLSFCRISGTDEASLVAGTRPPDVLSNLVRDGDVIIFGDTFNSDTVWVDTVLCIYGTATIPALGKQFILEEQFDRYRQDVLEFVGGISWEKFTTFRDYRRNLVDTVEPGGKHTSTGVVPHKQLIGRRAQHDQVPTDREKIHELFSSGDGFNFIPLRATSARHLTNNKQEHERPGLLVFTFELRRLLEDVESRVHLLSDDLGQRLLHAILGASTFLVLDPVQPLATSAR